MVLGAIDIGTNSCRMLIIEYSKGEFKELKNSLTTTRLGEDVDKTGILKKEAIKRTVVAIKHFIKEMSKYQVDKIEIKGTSALRDVSNSTCLLKLVKKETGFDINIISGEEEAYLSYAGVVYDFYNKDILIIDIGGGSTELIWYKDGVLRVKSLNIGAVRMTERFISCPQIPVSDEIIKLINSEVRSLLEQEFSKQINNVQAVGIGGTITSLAAMELELTYYDKDRVHHYLLSYEKIKSLFNKLRKLSLVKRKEIRGLQPDRADIIVAGITILLVVMEYFQLSNIIVSEHDLLYGIIKKMI